MATINDGQFVDFALTATGLNGTYSSNISVACQNLPALTTCSFTPGNSFPNAPPGGSTITVRIQTTAAGLAQLEAPDGLPRSSPPPLLALWMGLPGLALVGLALAGGRTKRRGLGTLCLLLLVGMMGLMLAACGGGGGDAVAPRLRPGTPPGTYSIGLRTTAAGTLEHSVNLTVVVQ
jgi:hypothetical protein